MPLPKRPFTTTSLTSTLKSTIANQPLLSNLNNNIDKLSSQATSFAQKTPFFGAINPQQQQQQQQQNADATNSSHLNDSRAPSADPTMMRSNMGGPHHQGGSQQASKPTAPLGAPRQMDTSPAVDMSHLTEEERLMIQSVMAKAEMADMGMPVDTSVPSSTNLPSNASNVLVQQQQQARLSQQQQQQQQQQQRQVQQSMNNQQMHQNQQQQQHPMQQPQHMNQNSINQQQPNLMNTQMQANNPPVPNSNHQQTGANLGQGHGQIHATNPAQQFQQIQQQQPQPSQPQHQYQTVQQQQQQPFQQNLQAQTGQFGQPQQVATGQVSFNNNQQATLNSRSIPSIPSLEQQTQQLISQINSQFNLGGQNQQDQQQTQRNILNNQPTTSGQFGANRLTQPINSQGQLEQNIFGQSNHGQQSTMNAVGAGVPVQITDMSQQCPTNQNSMQQQLQQNQSQINPMMQMSQIDCNLNNQGSMNNPAQMIDSNQTAQQQQYFANMNKTLPENNNNFVLNQPLPQQFTYSQIPVSLRNDSQMNPNGTNSSSNFMPQQQVQNAMQGIQPADQGMNVTDFPGMQMSQFSESTPDTQVRTYGYNQGSERPVQNFRQTPYQDLRGIKFGQQLQDIDYDDQTLSDQEYHGGRSRRHHHARGNLNRYDSADRGDARGRNESVDSSERNLLAYDLAHKSQIRHAANSKQGSRKLPQPVQNVETHVNQHASSSPSDKYQQTNRSKKTKSSYSRSSSHRQTHDSPEYLTEGSEEIVSPEGDTIKPIKEKSTKSSGDLDKETVDKSDEAIRLLSELKLTEQANQMMEQQQLLIKQSQELIKLQLEQQALSQELKKSIKQGSASSVDDTKIGQKSDKTDHRNEQNDQETQSLTASTEKDNVKHETEIKQRYSSNDYEDAKTTEKDGKASTYRKLKTSTSRDQDSEIEDSPRAVTKNTNRFDDLMDSPYEGSFRQASEKNREKGVIGGRKSNLANSSAQTCPSPRYNRDLMQSPTDTTDSDIEPISQSNSRKNQHRMNQSPCKPKSIVRRREPTGLPPSPLPVAAAIQLHQMQQQHFRNQMTVAGARNNLSRQNFLRSRSVTSSPNHLLDRSSAAGFLTDSHQRVRSTSPDTLSEFGGQRRRKRLPEPPSNAVPITPSMVRKMIQAQRAGANAGKMLTSVNAQSTLLNNTHSNRNLAFDRNPISQDNLTSFSKPFAQINEPLAVSSGTFSTNPKTSLPTNDSLKNFTNPSGISTRPPGASDLNKFLSSTYGNSILKNSITDVKETPELDKLIGNLDEFYNIDSKTKHVRLAQPSTTPLNKPYNQSFSVGSTTNPSSLNPQHRTNQHSSYSANTFSNDINTEPDSYLSNNRLDSGVGIPSYLLRRSSEGEHNLSRLSLRRPYRQANLDDSFRNYGRNYTASSYLDGRSSSYLGADITRQPRYTNSMGTADRHKDHSIGHVDNWSSGTNSSGRFERSVSTNQYYPSSRESLMRPKLNITGSFDYDNLDYPNEQRLLSAGVSDMHVSNTGRYQNPYAANSNLDPLRNRYRYQGYNDRNDVVSSSPRYQVGLNSETNPPTRRINTGSHVPLSQFQHKSLDLDTRRDTYYGHRGDPSFHDTRLSTSQYPEGPSIEAPNYYDSPIRSNAASATSLSHDYYRPTSYAESRANLSSGNYHSTLTKNDIINNGPKFNSIGYRFRTENQNKYVTQARTPTQCLQSSYPHPYKRILLSKNPKDRIGNGIGIRIIGGQPIPNLYDKVNRCIVSSGAFVTEVFQSSNVHFNGEMKEGDQIIEWNGVNLCNRSDEEVQEILLSQFSDDEVEIVYLPRKHMSIAYDEVGSRMGVDYIRPKDNGQPDLFDTFADMNKSGHRATVTPITSSRYGNDSSKGNIRRKISLSSIAQMWST